MGGIEERREYIRVDCADGGPRETLRLYQEDQLSLRDAFTAMVLAGIAPGFRIALVAPAGPIAAAFRGDRAAGASRVLTTALPAARGKSSGRRRPST